MAGSRLARALVLLSGVWLSGKAGLAAAAFVLEPTLGIQETLTNNVNLAPSGQAQSDLVTQLTPGFVISESGAHTLVQGTVTLPILLYARTGAQNNDAVVTADVLGRAELLEKFFYLEGDINVSQQYFTPLGAQPVGLSNATQNRYTSETYRVTPYIKGTAQGNLDYEVRDDNIWASLANSPVSVSGAYTNNLTARIARPPTPLGWSAEYDRTSVTYNGQPPLLSQLGRITLYHAVNPQLELSADVGYENNDYTLTSSRDTIYGVGAIWHPTDRTNVAGNWEHRFFGSSYVFNFTHRMPLTAWDLNASRNITTYAQQVGQLPAGFDTQSLLNLLFLSSIPDPAQRQSFINQFIRDRGLPAFLADPVALYNQQILLQESATASVGLLGARNTIFLSVFYLQQQPITAAGTPIPGVLAGQNNTTQVGAGAGWTNNLTPNLTFALTGNVSKSWGNVVTSEATSQATTRQGYVAATLSTSLSRNTQVNGGVRYQVLRSDASSGYTEAAVYVGLFHQFR